MINHILPIFSVCVYIVHLCGALMIESPVATRKTSVNPLVLNNINRSTAFCNPFGNCASQLVPGRLGEGPTLFSEGGLAHST